MTDGRGLFDELWKFYEQQLSAESVSAFGFAELVTYLLFLKIDDERSDRHLNPVQVVPDGLGWSSLINKAGKVLDAQFRHVLQECGKLSSDPETLIRRAVFQDAAPPLRNPAKLSMLIKDVIGPRLWSTQPSESLAGMYTLLLEKASADFRIDSGQTLTPLPFVSAVVDCLVPTSSDTVLDPACGTGSFVAAAYEAMAVNGVRLESGAVKGLDFDVHMGRFATMNYLLRTRRPFNVPPPIKVENSLAAPYTGRPTIIVCNPPFRSTAPLPKGRADFLAVTPSMQLNFLQHIARALPIGGRAAVFVPDNILFRGGAEQTVRQWLFNHCDVHTLIRLPTGVFAQSGVKSNVLFFDRIDPRGHSIALTEKVWIYDFRTGRHYAAKQNPLRRADLDDFVQCYGSGKPRTERKATARFRPVTYAELLGRGLNVDIFWPDVEVSLAMSSPKQIAREIVDDLSAALEEFSALADELPDDPAVEAQGGEL
jgi:type I restriction enzyme M protein